MSEGWIHIPNWDDHQHRDAARANVPTWTKLYTELGSKPEWLDLTFHQRGLLVSIWIEYARSKRQLRSSTAALCRLYGGDTGVRVTARDLKSLSDAGFIEISASRYASTIAGSEKKREEVTPLTPLEGGKSANAKKRRLSKRELRRYTGCRSKWGMRGMVYVRDPLGTSKPPSDWPYDAPTEAEILAALDEKGAAA